MGHVQKKLFPVAWRRSKRKGRESSCSLEGVVLFIYFLVRILLSVTRVTVEFQLPLPLAVGILTSRISMCFSCNENASPPLHNWMAQTSPPSGRLVLQTAYYIWPGIVTCLAFLLNKKKWRCFPPSKINIMTYGRWFWFLWLHPLSGS